LCTYVNQKLAMFILLFWKWLINFCEVLMMACVLELYLIWYVGYTDKYCSWVSSYHTHMQSSKTRFMYIKVFWSHIWKLHATWLEYITAELWHYWSLLPTLISHKRSKPSASVV